MAATSCHRLLGLARGRQAAVALEASSSSGSGSSGLADHPRPQPPTSCTQTPLQAVGARPDVSLQV
jgi:hypothetical protein